MGNKFLELPKEKQLRIINAGMEYFGKYGYKNTKTDDIAARAGISKGLLFYYFKNKKSFYLYLYHFCESVMLEYMQNQQLNKLTDFFEIIDYGAKKKIEIITQYPYMMNFVMKAFYSQKEEISDDIQTLIQATGNQTLELYFQHVDQTKFKEGIDFKDIYQMLVWMTEGYLLDKMKTGMPIEMEMMMEEFEKWKKMFKKMCYREEYQ
ncbi:MAG: TetR/AcrR family transcriptional regulator [Coprobacillus cateniformis]|uniref:TetR/AcrR family transcriptional regulator n=1 Tax=Longibaculum muris TaxID=1796628 RepID=UPI0029FF1614|nr:TetR/AcrR family transcriptional regulator [Coprobacillus cateniformis]